MRTHAEQDARLGQQRVAVGSRSDRADLERDGPVELVVERLDDPTLTAVAGDLQQLVAIAQTAQPRGPLAVADFTPHTGEPSVRWRRGRRDRGVDRQRSARASSSARDRATIGKGSENDIVLVTTPR